MRLRPSDERERWKRGDWMLCDGAGSGGSRRCGVGWIAGCGQTDNYNETEEAAA